jgi:hypothetical protein
MMDECEKCTITKPRKTGVTETVEEGEREREREREREQELVASMTSQAQDYLRSFYAHQILEKIEFLEIYVPKS